MAAGEDGEEREPPLDACPNGKPLDRCGDNPPPLIIILELQRIKAQQVRRGPRRAEAPPLPPAMGASTVGGVAVASAGGRREFVVRRRHGDEGRVRVWRERERHGERSGDSGL